MKNIICGDYTKRLKIANGIFFTPYRRYCERTGMTNKRDFHVAHVYLLLLLLLLLLIGSLFFLFFFFFLLDLFLSSKDTNIKYFEE